MVEDNGMREPMVNSSRSTDGSKLPWVVLAVVILVLLRWCSIIPRKAVSRQ